jgi:glucose/mannose-6-phosphate isomerase
MIDLNDLEAIKQLDPKDVYGSTGYFVDQCQFMVDEYYGKGSPVSGVQNLVISGMGGSAYGAHVVQSLYSSELKVPLVPVSDYHLPGFVDANTLVLVTSYSGTTEEVVSTANEAKAKGAKLAALSSGGTLGQLVSGGAPGIVFDPKLNPSGQPRLGTGYIITGSLVLLNNLGLLQISKDDLNRAIGEVRGAQESIKQTAQAMAKELEGYIPVTFASQHLVGNAHIIRNQFNETSKSFSAYEDVPELNHHLMEGLKNPADKKLKAILITSNLYEAKHQLRMEVTADVVQQNGMPYVEYAAGGSTKLAQMLNVLAFGGYLTLYLGLIYGQDPSLIPWVDYFKAKLG